METESLVEVSKQKKKAKKIILISAAIFLLALSILLGGLYSSVSKYNLVLYPGIWIEDIDVGGKTKEEAKEALTVKHINLMNNNAVKIKVNDKEYKISGAKFDLKCDYDDILDKAYKVGRESNIFEKYSLIKKADKKSFELQHAYNYEVVDEIIKNIEKENNTEPADASISKGTSGEFVIVQEKYGYKLNSQKLKEEIKAKIDNMEKDNNLLVIASLEKNDPKIKEEALKSINTKISSFTTSFKTSDANRSTNIAVASKAINGKLLMPGEVFSFNDVVGDRTAENGYRMAHVIVNKELVDGIGGGVCQVSTTLYNSALRAGLETVQRFHHSIPSSYVGLGLDATVAYGLLDYKFKNTLAYPIYIETVVKNKNLTVNVYSNSSLQSKSYNVVNEVGGEKVKVYRITYEQGKFVSKELLTTDKLS